MSRRSANLTYLLRYPSAISSSSAQGTIPRRDLPDGVAANPEAARATCASVIDRPCDLHAIDPPSNATTPRRAWHPPAGDGRHPPHPPRAGLVRRR